MVTVFDSPVHVDRRARRPSQAGPPAHSEPALLDVARRHLPGDDFPDVSVIFSRGERDGPAVLVRAVLCRSDRPLSVEEQVRRQWRVMRRLAARRERLFDDLVATTGAPHVALALSSPETNVEIRYERGPGKRRLTCTRLHI